MIQFKKLAQFFRLLKMMVATMNSIFSISCDKKNWSYLYLTGHYKNI